jgi:amino acid adenylation domain-containing protein
VLTAPGGDVHAGAAPAGPEGGEVVVFPLSFPQQRLWLIDQVEPGSPAYNLPTMLRARAPLDAAALERALAEIVARHESLRTRFAVVDAEPAQLVEPPGRLVLPVADLASLPGPAREAEAGRLAAAEGRTPFDLGRGPLFRARLLRLAPEEHLLLVTLHHIVSDGWSIGVLLRELSVLYRAFAAGEPSPLPELPIQYGDYAVWQREELAGEALDEQVAFWRAELEGAPPATQLPVDRPHPRSRGGRGGKHVVAVSVESSRRLAALARAEGATTFMALLAACGAWLGRYADAEDVVLGTPIAGRTQEELEALIGFFVNTLAIRVDLSGDPTFAELVARVRARLLGAYAHQDLPFEKVVEELRVPRDPGRTPVFQVMFLLQAEMERRAEEPAADGPAWKQEPAGTGTAKFDVTLGFVERPQGLAASLDYDAGLFDAATVERMGRHLLHLLDAVAADPLRRLSDVPLLPLDEERRVLAEWNDTRREYPRAPVHRLVVEQAGRTPGALAAVFPDADLTYGELDRRSAVVAARLRAAGVGPEARVALLAGRTPAMLAGVLGILRAGGAYVPLDPAAPAERIAFFLRDSGARVLLGEPALLDLAAGFEGVVLPLGGDAPPPEADPGPGPEVPPEALAYVIYTSGSTGAPKGVMVHHCALANLAHAEVELHGFGPSTRLFSTLAVSFDASAGDIFPALLCGGALVLHPAPGELSAAEMLAFARRHGADAAGIPVALWSHWLDQLEAAWDGEPLPLPRTTRVGGESLSLERARAWRRLGGGRVRLFNHYGPTETTVIVTAHESGAAAERDTVSGSVPIGRPLPNTAGYVLDRHLRPVSVGAAGELFVGGVQVARGYLGRPQLTARTFLPDPFSGRPGARMYRTGDRVRRLPDGVLEFLGRTDGQVKIRGYRVEPAEVEAALLAHTEVWEAAVGVGNGPGGEPRLVGYFVAAGDGTDPAALREHLRARLPDYMVPAALVRLDALPLTSNGKVDRRALPAPPDADPAAYVAPRTAAEEALAAVWAEVLGVERVGVRDDFFELGGHSLSAARLVARVRERLGRELSLGELFRGATVERLARALEGGAPTGLPASLVRLRDGAGTPFFCVHAAGGMAMAYLRLARRLDDRPFYGVQARGLAPGETPAESVEEMAARYVEAVRVVQPRGPYLLGGWSVGGNIAWEMAQRLRAAGEEVAHLALVDCWAPLDGSRPPLPDDADLLALLAADLGVRAEPGTLASLRDELRTLPPDARLTRFAGWIRRLEPGTHDLDDAGLRRRLDVYRATARAASAYRARPYDGRVTLFRASRSAAWPSGDLSAEAWERDPRLRWRELLTRPLEVRGVPGTHHSIVVGPDVEGLAAALRDALGAGVPA